MRNSALAIAVAIIAAVENCFAGVDVTGSDVDVEGELEAFAEGIELFEFAFFITEMLLESLGTVNQQ
jgi:hypothetical protein